MFIGGRAAPDPKRSLKRTGSDSLKEVDLTLRFQNYSTQAGGQDAVSQGVELYAQHTLPFGLGVQFNYTYNDASKAAVRLEDGTEAGKTSMPGSARKAPGTRPTSPASTRPIACCYARRTTVAASWCKPWSTG